MKTGTGTRRNTQESIKWLTLCAGLVCLFGLGGEAFGKGLRVSPAAVAIEATPGEPSGKPGWIRITNVSSRQRSYRLIARHCSQIGAAVMEGFEPLGDLSWVQFDRSYVSILPQGQASAQIRVNVPEGARYAGRAWQFTVEIREEVPRYGYLQGRPDIFALAVYLRATVRTPEFESQQSAQDGDGVLPLIPQRHGWRVPLRLDGCNMHQTGLFTLPGLNGGACG